MASGSGPPATYEERRAQLFARMDELGRLAVAFSGGVDSSALLHAAQARLGRAALAVIADSPSLPRRELAEARELCARIGARLVEVRTSELDDPRYQENAGDRCYFCKAALFDAMTAVCAEEGIPWMVFGEITDDWGDDRPGARAAKERGVVAPLSEAGFDKNDVRRYAHEAGLDVADKPASACLSSRIPVGRRVTRAELATVEEAEEALRGLGLRQLRVRHLGHRARVEVGADELVTARASRDAVGAALLALGFEDFDLEVYRQGSVGAISRPGEAGRAPAAPDQ